MTVPPQGSEVCTPAHPIEFTVCNSIPLCPIVCAVYFETGNVPCTVGLFLPKAQEMVHRLAGPHINFSHCSPLSYPGLGVLCLMLY